MRKLKYWIFATFGKREIEQTYTGHGDRMERCYYKLFKWELDA